MIILTGPPGAGKTTVAELLASEASSPAVHLTTDQFYRSIRSGFVLPFRPAAHRQNEVVIRAAADRDDLTLSYVVLRPDLDTTLSRARQRAEHELKDVEAITGLYAAFERLADLEDHAIDTGKLDAVQTAAEVRRVLASGEYRLS